VIDLHAEFAIPRLACLEQTELFRSTDGQDIMVVNATRTLQVSVDRLSYLGKATTHNANGVLHNDKLA